MFYRLSGVALATLILGTIDVVAADLPVYEVAGLPITPHQLMVLGPAGAEQDHSPFIQTMAGMPASPHQIAVLTPRPAQIGQQASTSGERAAVRNLATAFRTSRHA